VGDISRVSSLALPVSKLSRLTSQSSINHAKPRFIPKQSTNGVKVHRSVKIRMEAEYENEDKRRKGVRYEPRAHLRVEPTWID